MKNTERTTLQRLLKERLPAGLIIATTLSLTLIGPLLAQQPLRPPLTQEPAPPPPPPGPGPELAPPPPPAPVDQTTTIHGTVSQYVLNPDGVVDGLLLTDNTIVRFPPHLSQQLVQSVKPQDQVQVEGFFELQGVTQAVTIKNTDTRQSVVDAPPPPQNPPPPPAPSSRQPMSASGTIKVLTHARQGEIDGAVLDNGTIVHLPPRVGLRFVNLLVIGASLATSGYGTANAYGRCLEVNSIGPSADQMQNVVSADEGRGRPGRRRPPE